MSIDGQLVDPTDYRLQPPKHIHRWRWDSREELFICRPCPNETKQNLSCLTISEVEEILDTQWEERE